jgi:hypothetical protein
MSISRKLQAVAIAAALVTGTAGSSSMLRSRQGRDFDLVASANPAAPRSFDVDRTAMYERANGKRVQADAVATSSALCDSCHGTATAVQVIYVSKARKATADNTATAWSSCRNCRATSVSVQIIVAKPSVALTVRNQALAVNANCTGCNTAAVAIQFVVHTQKRHTLSSKERAQLEAMAREIESDLSTTPRSANARTLATKARPGLDGIQDLLKRRLQPTTIKPHFATKTG